MTSLLQIHHTQIFHGPNIYANSPIILIDLQINPLLYTKMITTCDKIMKQFPQWFQQDINKNVKPEIYIGTVMSHLSLSLLNHDQDIITESGVKLSEKGIYFWTGFYYPKVSLKAINLAFYILNIAMKNNNLSNDIFKDSLDNFNDFCQKTYLINENLLKMSHQFDIPLFPYLNSTKYIQYGWGKKSRVFLQSSSMEDSFYGVQTSMDKSSSKNLLQSIGIPTAKSVIIHSPDQLEKAIQTIGFPCVVKPIRGAQGIGITSNIQDFHELEMAYDYAKNSSFGKNPIMIESFIQGDDHRLFVANGKFLGIGKRIPSHIIGDGKSTVKKLIDDLNQMRINPKQNILGLKQIQYNNSLTKHLRSQGITINDILDNNRKITLSEFGSYSTGGFPKDVTSIAHPQIKCMAELIAQASNIATLGVDYITTDISKPYTETNGAVTEYNHYPGLSFLEYISNPKESFYQILNIGSGRIPLIIAIIDTSHFSQIQKWLMCNVQDQRIGWVCGNNVQIGQFPLHTTDTHGWQTVKMLLRQKTLEKALIICSPEEIIQKGLPVDKADHICISGINMSPGWNAVLQNTSPNIKTFNAVSSLLLFSLEALVKKHSQDELD